MAWLAKNTLTPSDKLSNDMLNSLANDDRNWGGNVNGGGYALSNVVLQQTSPFPIASGPAGSSCIQLNQGALQRWTVCKDSSPESTGNAGSNFAIARYSDAGAFIDSPFTINRAGGYITLGVQLWNGAVNGGGFGMINVASIGVGISAPAAAVQVAADAPRQLYLTSSTAPAAKQMRIGYDVTNNTGVVEAFNTSPCALLLNPNAANVGIGPPLPNYPLHISTTSHSGTPTLNYHSPEAGFGFDVTANGELALGWLGAPPWGFWLQGRGTGSNPIDLYLNPKGGMVGIGNANPLYALHVTGDVNCTGSFRVNGVAIPSASDARMKRNVRPLDGGLLVIQQLHPVWAEWNGLGGRTAGEPVISVIAQQVQAVEPDAVRPFRCDGDEFLAIEPLAIISHLILAVQQLAARLQSLDGHLT